MVRPRKAVLPVGGWGTRFLPVTKAVPKAMLPIMNKPIVHYVVDEAVAAELETVLFVITPNNRAIEDYFSPCAELEGLLEKMNKHDAAEELRKITRLAEFSFIPGKPRGQERGLGTAVFNARSAVGEEPFAVLLPNDIVETEIPCTRSLMAVYSALNCPILAIHRVAEERLSTYGNVGVRPLGKELLCQLHKGPYIPDRVWEVTKLIQKPDPKKREHLSDFAVIGRFILPPEIFAILESIPGGYDGEVQLIDALEQLRQAGQKVYGYEFSGRYFDTRSELGYLEAVVNEAGKQPHMRTAIQNLLLSRGE